MAGSIITQDELKEILHYNPDTGIFIWIKPNSFRMKIGDEAGWLTKKEYMRVTIKYKCYLLHRLAWLYMFGNFPKNLLDHINGVRNENRICNLREASESQNIFNSKPRKDNATGFKGVYFDKNKSKYHARCQINKKGHSLGYFETAELANEAYCNFAKIHHGEFYYQSSQPT